MRTINRDRVQPTTTFCMIKAKTRTGALTYGNYTGPYKYIPESTNSTVLVALNKLGQARSGTTHRVQNLIVSDSFDARLSVWDRSCQPSSSLHVHHILHAFDTIRKSTSRKAPSSKTTNVRQLMCGRCGPDSFAHCTSVPICRWIVL